ncbi:MAG: lytic transglycosylase domain-containing protein, partial [Spirochaetales bacterium]
ILIFSITMFFSVSAVGCRPVEVWNMPLDVFSAKLKAGDWDFLTKLDYSKLDLDEISLLGSGAPYYTARVFTRLDMPEMAESMYRLQILKGGSIWARHSAYELTRALIRADRDREALALAAKTETLFPGDPVLMRLKTEADYWLKNWAEVTGAIAPESAPAADPEKLLFNFVALFNSGSPSWKEPFLALFTGFRTSDLHTRAYQFVAEQAKTEQKPPQPLSLDSLETSLLEARYLSAAGDAEKASGFYGSLLGGGSPRFLTKSVLEDAVLQYIRAGRQSDGIPKFKALASGMLKGDKSLLMVLYECLGRLYRTSNQFAEAAGFFIKAVSTDQKPQDYDRVLWYYLDCVFKSDKALFLDQLGAFARTWNSPSYFADILEDSVVYFAGQKDWTSLEKLHLAAGLFADDDSASRTAFVLARAMDSGLYAAAGGLKSAGLLEFIKSRKKNQYYRYLCYAIYHDSAFLHDLPAAGAGKTGAAGTAVPGPVLPEDDLVAGFMHFGLFEEGFEKARELGDLVSGGALFAAAETLNKNGFFYESIQTIAAYHRRPDTVASRETLSLAYPKGYGDLVYKYARKESVSLPLLFALVREESYFDPAIVSRAGAVGLSQLMPATAADVARALKLENPDLKDPEQNLAIGSRYFHTMLTKLDRGYWAIAAYNAGPNRVKQWQALYSGLPDEIFAEVIPFEETRGHIRKILVSAVLYGFLYENKGPGDVIPFIFPMIGGVK